MVQAFLPDVAQGDKRIVLVDGEVAGAINRMPGEGEIRSNLAVGGSAAKTELTAARARDLRRARPRTQARGLLFVGIDVIGGEWLTEINVTSPTGIVAIEQVRRHRHAGADLGRDRSTPRRGAGVTPFFLRLSGVGVVAARGKVEGQHLCRDRVLVDGIGAGGDQRLDRLDLLAVVDQAAECRPAAR